jgi:hypothetical protein
MGAFSILNYKLFLFYISFISKVTSNYTCVLRRKKTLLASSLFTKSHCHPAAPQLSDLAASPLYRRISTVVVISIVHVSSPTLPIVACALTSLGVIHYDHVVIPRLPNLIISQATLASSTVIHPDCVVSTPF